MPGIAGVISTLPEAEAQARVGRMLRSMLHEPFYTHGTYSDTDLGLFLGYCAIEGSFADCMPVQNADGSVVLFLTGECYLDHDQLNELGDAGRTCSPDNAQCLVYLYERDPEAFFSGLNGWCNGIVLDSRRGEMILFNDRNGIRRLYYHEFGEGIAFASEAKALMAAFPESRAVDARGVADYLVYDCVLEDRTFFKEISLLPPGSAWRIQPGGTVSRRRYFDPKQLEEQSPLREHSMVDEIDDTFSRVLPRYFRGGRVGLSLTGGLDTRMILACRDAEPGELPCYTFGGTYRDILDVRLAPRAAAAAQQPHEVLRIDDHTFLDEYPAHLERSIRLTDGLEGVDKVDMIPFCAMAREVAPIRMTGKYGSQVLKSVLGFKERVPVMDLIAPDFQPMLVASREIVRGLTFGHPLTFLLQREIPWWWNGFVVSESSQGTVRSPFLDNDLIALLYRTSMLSKRVGADTQLELIHRHAPALLGIPTTGSHGGDHGRIVGALVKGSYEALAKLDKLFIREQLPFHLKHPFARAEYVMAASGLDRRLLGTADRRRYRLWFRRELADFIRDTLLSERTLCRPYWDRRWLHKVVTDHIAYRKTYYREIRKVLQVEMIHRVLIEDGSCFAPT